MTGKTHLITGAFTGLWLASELHASPTHALLIIGAGAAGSLLPDIDHQQSMLGRRLPPISWLISKLGHRAATHSIAALVLIALLGMTFHPVYGLAFALGYGSHILEDMFTNRGVAALWPLTSNRLHALPNGLRITTGGLIDRGIALAIIAVVIWQYIGPLQPQIVSAVERFLP
jgi:inner membrane protein